MEYPVRLLERVTFSFCLLGTASAPFEDLQTARSLEEPLSTTCNEPGRINYQASLAYMTKKLGFLRRLTPNFFRHNLSQVGRYQVT